MKSLTPHLPRIRDVLGVRSLELGPRIQSLWSGYGEVRRLRTEHGTVVVKHVQPPPDAHPRKLRSYAVEKVFYERYASQSRARVARCHGVWETDGGWVFVLEDLGQKGLDTGDALRWLAAFHASFLGVQPEGLWEVGTYWHLATRPDELHRMRDERLRREAPELDRRLREATFQTFVHGDAKSANFCGGAAVDFQYVGGGPGIRDVAYLLEGFRWRPLGRERMLDLYFEALDAQGVGHVEDEWRGLYGVCKRDFARFLDGWR